MTDAPSPALPADPGRRAGLALAVAAAVDTVRGVRRSEGGAVPPVTLYPGGQVSGIVLGAASVTVHVTLTEVPSADLGHIGDQVAQVALGALRDRDDPRNVLVVIDDLAVDGLPPRSTPLGR